MVYKYLFYNKNMGNNFCYRFLNRNIDLIYRIQLFLFSTNNDPCFNEMNNHYIKKSRRENKYNPCFNEMNNHYIKKI